VDLNRLLSLMRSSRASDLHLRVGMPPTMRVDGELVSIDEGVLRPEDLETAAEVLLTPDQKERFDSSNELDLALSVRELGRYRVNLYRQRGTVGIALRAVNTEVPAFEELNLPEVVRELAHARRGLIVVTGTTGSGKSTTLAAMIDLINESKRVNILTIEDPIEYVHYNKNSMIVQREIGADTDNFSTALRQAFRQDPDVILIGEIRDSETMGIALAAADTGHLVLSTLHTLNSIETISRIISFFPPHQHQQVRLLLAGTLKAIICQRLLPLAGGEGRVPAAEVLVNTAAVRECLLDPEKTSQIRDLIESGAVEYGMQSFDQSIMKFYSSGLISFEEAVLQADNPEDFRLRAKGIIGAAERGWREFTERSER
jgi:twitching motility protein PilT